MNKKIVCAMAFLLLFTDVMSQAGKKDSISQPLKTWDRKYFETPLERPFLFYVIHGNFSPGNHISTAKYRTAGVPAGIGLMKYGSEKHPEYLKSFSEGYLWNKLVKEDSALSKSITNSKECIVLTGNVADTTNLNYLRDVVGVIAYLLDNGGVSVYDPQGFMFFGKSAWNEKIFEPNGAVPRNHAMILYSSENGKRWYHTRGMRKFGRPDLSIHNVPSAYEDAIEDLFNRFIEFEAFGGIIKDGQKINMASLPKDMWCENKGDFEDPDFNNKHVEIYWK